MLDGLSIVLTGVGRGLGSAEDDRRHQAALTRWLVEELAGVDERAGIRQALAEPGSVRTGWPPCGRRGSRCPVA